MKEHLIVRDLLGLAAAGALDPPEQRRVEEHLRQCEECRAELNSWNRLAGALKDLPTPQAPHKLILQTRRLLEIHAAGGREHRESRLVLAFLATFSWVVMSLNWRLVRWLDIRLAHWLDVSSTAAWVAYIGVIWLATALAAGLMAKYGLIAKHAQQEGKIV
jgi:anti-sigma factor RsiW